MGSLFLKAVNNCLVANGAEYGEFMLQGDDAYENITEWFCEDSEIPTESQVTTEHERLVAEATATEYQRHRARLYPSWGELADAIYHKEVNNDASKMTEYIEKCDAVKALFPKENTGDGSIFVNPQGTDGRVRTNPLPFTPPGNDYDG